MNFAQNSSTGPRAADPNIAVRSGLLSVGAGQRSCQLGYDLLQQEEKFSIKVLGNSAVTTEARGDKRDWLGISSQSDQAEFRQWSVNGVVLRGLETAPLTRYCKDLCCRVKLRNGG